MLGEDLGAVHRLGARDLLDRLACADLLAQGSLGGVMELVDRAAPGGALVVVTGRGDEQLAAHVASARRRFTPVVLVELVPGAGRRLRAAPACPSCGRGPPSRLQAPGTNSSSAGRHDEHAIVDARASVRVIAAGLVCLGAAISATGMFSGARERTRAGRRRCRRWRGRGRARRADATTAPAGSVGRGFHSGSRRCAAGAGPGGPRSWTDPGGCSPAPSRWTRPGLSWRPSRCSSGLPQRSVPSWRWSPDGCRWPRSPDLLRRRCCCGSPQPVKRRRWPPPGSACWGAGCCLAGQAPRPRPTAVVTGPRLAGASADTGRHAVVPLMLTAGLSVAAVTAGTLLLAPALPGRDLRTEPANARDLVDEPVQLGRATSPLSRFPALHTGADRVLFLGAHLGPTRRDAACAMGDPGLLRRHDLDDTGELSASRTQVAPRPVCGRAA